MTASREVSGPNSMLDNFKQVLHTNRSGLKTGQQKKRRLNSFLNDNGFGSLPNQGETRDTLQNSIGTISKTNSLPVNVLLD